MGFLKELVKLTRFEHAIMLAFAVLIAETMVLRTLPQLTAAIALSLLVPIFSEMGSFALNDYLDIAADRKNGKKDRPLVKGTISPRFALGFSAATLIVSTALAWFINPAVFALALVFNLFAIAYNWKLKDLPLAGNAYIALTMAVPFIFGNFVVSSILSPLIVVLATLGFVAGLAREIIKSVQDMEGDVAARGSKTLPVVIGKKPALAVACALYALFIPLTAVPFALGLNQNPFALGMVIAGNLGIALVLYKMASSADKSFGFVRNASLVAFGIGMAGLLIAAL